jgi:hypothetical protein
LRIFLFSVKGLLKAWLAFTVAFQFIKRILAHGGKKQGAPAAEIEWLIITKVEHSA